MKKSLIAIALAFASTAVAAQVTLSEYKEGEDRTKRSERTYQEREDSRRALTREREERMNNYSRDVRERTERILGGKDKKLNNID